MNAEIIIVAGGTGGHVCPALALARYLHHHQNQNIVFHTDPRGVHYIKASEESFKVVVMPLQSRQYPWKFIKSLVRCFWQASKEVVRQKPRAVVSFGGYSALTWGLVAGLFRIPLILHEQNARSGRTQRLLAWWAKCTALTFDPAPQQALKKGNQKLTGLPLRSEFKKKSYQIPTSSEQFRLLITGGSQGAQFFNDLLPHAISLLPEAWRRRLHVDQQCVITEQETIQKAYDHLQVSATLTPYFEDMVAKIAAAHLIIARAGASTLAEIATVGRPAVLIPYPYAQDDHQTVNAQVYIKKERGWWFDQKKVTPQRLANFLEQILENPQLLILAAESAAQASHMQATEAVSDLVLRNLLSPPKTL